MTGFSGVRLLTAKDKNQSIKHFSPGNSICTVQLFLFRIKSLKINIINHSQSIFLFGSYEKSVLLSWNKKLKSLDDSKVRMAGIYFHIPFCKTRCIYCDFFSSSCQDGKIEYVDTLCRELEERKNYLQEQTVNTIYFGGGSPSQLSAGDFERIFDRLFRLFNLNLEFFLHGKIEVTLEANPDDITPEYLNSIRYLPFNRISLGVQSFNDNELKFLNRRHDAQTAIRAVELCRKQGFENISIDLMYGLPGQRLEIWEENIRQAILLNVQHLSAYHLIYEEGTLLFEWLRQGRIKPVDENLSVSMFEILIDKLSEAGFEQYEISNFAQSGYYSQHNSSYWNGAHYLGIGASAHSYNGISRRWNKKVHGAQYLDYGFEIEIIDRQTAYREFIITRLRTMKGIDLNELQELFGSEKQTYCLKRSQKYIDSHLLEISDNHLKLNKKGIFISDGIMSDLI
jgi:oxygen-independent coproporphyrinogen-3 oxidase